MGLGSEGAGAGSGHLFLPLCFMAHASSLDSDVVGVFTLWTPANGIHTRVERSRGSREARHSVGRMRAEVAFGS